MNKNGRNFWLDVIMFLAFLITVVSGFVLWPVTGFSSGLTEPCGWRFTWGPGLLVCWG